jgi:hypothetical protein
MQYRGILKHIISDLHETVAIILEPGCDTNGALYDAPRHATRSPFTEDLHKMRVNEIIFLDTDCVFRSRCNRSATYRD